MMEKRKYQITYYSLEATPNHREHSKGPNPYAPVFDFKWAYSLKQAKMLSQRLFPEHLFYLSSVKEV
jgi:hypothetical protein